MKISIVGAGISGLATAQAVLARKPDVEIVVFEAERRVGVHSGLQSLGQTVSAVQRRRRQRAHPRTLRFRSRRRIEASSPSISPASHISPSLSKINFVDWAELPVAPRITRILPSAAYAARVPELLPQACKTISPVAVESLVVSGLVACASS
ncbi:MAG: NAD(P)-binding protein [Proteobacteria bacterium]|nr:NAD(P)-binding protein [Pseudomonadota bacterium]